MSDEGQRTFGDFEVDGGGDARPAEEAAAVAGNGGNGTTVVDIDERQFPDVSETVEFVVTQVDYTVEGQGDDEYPVVHVFGRTDDEDPVHARVYEFEPYFYVPADSVTEDRLRQYDRIVDWRYEDENGDPFESIRGERLLKIIGQTPRDVGQMRDDFDHYEADILFPNRLLIDKDITSGVRVPARELDDGSYKVHHEEVRPVEASAEPRVNTFDIEVDDRHGFPEDGEQTIVCLTSHDSYTDEYVVWLYESPDGIEGPEALAKYDPIREDADFEADVRVFEEEEAMLDAFISYIEDTDPDVLTGWNFDDFDAPYLLDRIEELQRYDHDYDLNVDRLSRVDEVWRSDWQGPDIKGRVVFDLLYAYKRTQFTELESYRLDAVGEQELGVGKERYTGDIGDLWEDDPERLLEYNLRDVELCVELDREQDIIDFWDEVRTFVGCKLEDATTPGDAVDMYVLHKLYGEFALPSKGQQESEDYEGGAVFDPITGVRENVTVLDLKSLYPMCMVTTNASPETKVDPETYDGDTYRAPNGTHFRKEPDGVIREMVDELLTEREEKKGLRNNHDPDDPEYERYDRQQAAVKVIMNCFTPDTDVLTPDGIRNIRDLEVGDHVYSLDPETLEMEVKPVVETQAYPEYRGELVDIETSKIDFRVTPNHRMLVRKNETNGITEDGYSFVEAGDLDDATNYELPHDWDGPDGERLDEVDLVDMLDGSFEVWCDNDDHGHTLAAEVGYRPDKMQKQGEDGTGYVFDAESFREHRAYLDGNCSGFYVHAERGRKWVPRFYDGDDFLELLAWYITEGSVYTSEDKQFGDQFRSSSTAVNIAQDAVPDGGSGDDRARIGTLLDSMGFDAYVDEKGYQFTSKLLGDLLERLCGGNSFEKRIPEFVFDTTQAQKRAFLDTLIAGDGDWQTNSWRYSTASERLRDDVLRLCAHLGLTASYTEDSGTYRIYVTEDGKNTLRMHRSGGTSTATDGVYCVTVADNHTLMAGRNGTFQFVGQSLYGVLGWDRFRLYDKEMGAAVTATGREVIDYTDEVVAEEGYEVVYGDTDSVMLQVGDVGPEDVDGAVEVTDEMRAKHPEMDDDELTTIAATIQKGFELEETINASYDDFALERLNAQFHRFEIEFEKLYRRFFQAGKKKRYAGHIVWKEGKHVDDIDITGFEYQRSDIAPITKRVQKDVIDRIVHGEDAENIKDYVGEVIEDYQAGNVDYDDVGIPGGIGKKLDNYDTDTAQVRGAKYANLLLGTNFKSGSKPKRLYLDRVHADFFERVEDELGLDPKRDPLYGEFRRNPDVICFEYADQIPPEFEIDWDKMLDKTLKGPIARILEALDISWNEVKSGQEQTGLGQYM
ncbi:Hint domain-containing protein [Halomicroarcula sp. S1AR25-4]|uniref:DNA polymerase domain-containing protein n=1 Tax=Haloarcula sp. S1AR25-4 TaxID=2950538 RepID=UPI00287481CA|nr:DNA polymerase domain-containing protein [Halomicroarcula sp. S1AR25-4]MDS0277381.1 Hint domain-containing protein [Halomicroarcula sp. S1AR25-4]